MITENAMLLGGVGLLKYRTGSLNGITLDLHHDNPHQIRRAFVGVITDRGPTGEADYTDARYWVKELIESSPNSRPPPPPPPPQVPLPPPPPRDATVPRPRWEMRETYTQAQDFTRHAFTRWITAYHLGEGSVHLDGDPIGESHTLSTNGNVLIHVFAFMSPAGAVSYYFASGGGGGGNTAMAVVVKTDYGSLAPENRFVGVKQVEDSLGFPFFVRVPEGEDPVKKVWSWPGTYARHYEAYRWSASEVTDETPILPVIQIEGKFYVQQFNRYSLQPRDPRVRTTDCRITLNPES